MSEKGEKSACNNKASQDAGKCCAGKFCCWFLAKCRRELGRWLPAAVVAVGILCVLLHVSGQESIMNDRFGQVITQLHSSDQTNSSTKPSKASHAQKSTNKKQPSDMQPSSTSSLKRRNEIGLPAALAWTYSVQLLFWFGVIVVLGRFIIFLLHDEDD